MLSAEPLLVRRFKDENKEHDLHICIVIYNGLVEGRYQVCEPTTHVPFLSTVTCPRVTAP